MNQLVKVVLVGDSNRSGIILNGKLVLSSDVFEKKEVKKGIEEVDKVVIALSDALKVTVIEVELENFFDWDEVIQKLLVRRVLRKSDFWQ